MVAERPGDNGEQQPQDDGGDDGGDTVSVSNILLKMEPEVASSKIDGIEVTVPQANFPTHCLPCGEFLGGYLGEALYYICQAQLAESLAAGIDALDPALALVLGREGLARREIGLHGVHT